MVEGRGYAGRLAERHREKKLRKLVEEKDKIIVIPDLENIKASMKKLRKKKISL